MSMSEAKLKSRKFLVWVVWFVLTVAVFCLCVIAMFVTKSMSETMTALMDKVLGWFFAVSMMYLGVNVGQKAALAISEALAEKVEESANE